MNRMIWVNDRSVGRKNVIFTINRSILLVLVLTLSSSLEFPALLATALGLNTGLRKGHAGWVLTIVQTGMIWIAYHLFHFKNPASPHLQLVGLTSLMILTLGAGFVGVLITHYRESKVASFWNSEGGVLNEPE